MNTYICISCGTENYLLTESDKKFAKRIANLIINDISALQNEANVKDEELKDRLSPEAVIELFQLEDFGILSHKMMKDVLREMFYTKRSALEIAQDEGLIKLASNFDLNKVVDRIINENQSVIEDYKSGKTKAIDYLLGLVINDTKGAADPQEVKYKLEERLSENRKC